MADDRPAITQQYSFAVGDDGETDGAIEPAEESVETSLETWGADVNHRERDTRIEQPEASSFGVDDRKTVTRGDGGEQRALFADTADDQQTLGGERAVSQCLFESDDNDDTDDTDDTDDEPAPSTNDEATTRAVATDGGHAEDPDDDEPDTDDQAERTDEDARENDTETSESGQEETFDPDAETVTDAWEGAYISTNWGYGQTNVELAQISEVSASGKTVLARLVGAERVGHGRTSKQLRPTANQYGDEFRLHVRSGGGDGDPMFRGSYPLGSNGDMDDGPTRLGWFSPSTTTRRTRYEQPELASVTSPLFPRETAIFADSIGSENNFTEKPAASKPPDTTPTPTRRCFRPRDGRHPRTRCGRRE
jgi:hypothetical protein